MRHDNSRCLMPNLYSRLPIVHIPSWPALRPVPGSLHFESQTCARDLEIHSRDGVAFNYDEAPQIRDSRPCTYL